MTIFTRNDHYYAHWCQGCHQLHLVPDYPASKAKWQFNGDYKSPTLTPSVRTTILDRTCHYFIKEGNIIYCEDCTHELKGQTLPLQLIPAEAYEYLI